MTLKFLPHFYRTRERKKFVKYLDDYLSDRQDDLSPITVKNYRYYLGRFSKDNQEWPVTSQAITRYLNLCREQGLSPHSIRSSYNALSAFFTWCVTTERITTNPIEKVKPPKLPEPTSRAVNREVIESFFIYLERQAGRAVEDGITWETIHDVRDLALFSFMYDSGARIRETSFVKVEHVNLDEGAVFLEYAKGGKPRFVVIGKNTRGDLNFLLKAREVMEIDTPYLFPAKYEGKWQQLKAVSIRKRLGAICERLNIPYFKPHQMRHTYALESLRNGASLSDVSRQLGHRSPITTGRYILAPESGRVKLHLESSPRDH